MPSLDTVKFKNDVVPLNNTTTTIYTVPANYVAVIKLLAFTNISNVADRTFDISYTASGGSPQQLIDAYSVTQSANIAYIFDDGKPFFMSEGDVLKGTGSNANDIIALFAAEEYFDPAR